ncbi:MAG: hypothetical protein AAFV49_02515 [Pseudomonadota bacterium]
MSALAVLRLLSGLALAYGVMQAIARANRELSQAETLGAQLIAVLIIICAPALATSHLLGAVGGSMAVVRVLAFAGLAAGLLLLIARAGPGEAGTERRCLGLITVASLALTVLGLAR